MSLLHTVNVDTIVDVLAGTVYSDVAVVAEGAAGGGGGAGAYIDNSTTVNVGKVQSKDELAKQLYGNNETYKNLWKLMKITKFYDNLHKSMRIITIYENQSNTTQYHDGGYHP